MPLSKMIDIRAGFILRKQSSLYTRETKIDRIRVTRAVFQMLRSLCQTFFNVENSFTKDYLVVRCVFYVYMYR